jgi:hypothetical protein
MDELIDRLIELKRIRDEAQAGIEAILGGVAEKKGRSPQKCSKCGEEGHTARTCAKQANGSEQLPANTI